MTFSGRVFKQQKGSAQTNHGGSRTAPAPIHPQAQRGARCLARDTNARATSSFSVVAQRHKNEGLDAQPDRLHRSGRHPDQDQGEQGPTRESGACKPSNDGRVFAG